MVIKTHTFRQEGHTLRVQKAHEFYRIEREDGAYREVRRALQDENVETPYLMLTERSIHPAELRDFNTGVWQAYWDVASLDRQN